MSGKFVGRRWDTDENQYAAYYYYHEYKPLEIPPTRVNDSRGRVDTSFFKSIPGIYDGIESWDIIYYVAKYIANFQILKKIILIIKKVFFSNFRHRIFLVS